jgi:hypothetical protein
LLPALQPSQLLLPALPTPGRSIEVARRYVGAAYVIDGNGQLIMGEADALLTVDLMALHLTWDGLQWCAV